MVFGCYRCESIEKDGYFHFGWSGQYPSVQIPSSDDLQGEDELDITGVIEMHILPGDICQIGVSGNQKLCDIGGPLIWVTSKGTVSLDIYTDTCTIVSKDYLL